jgi:hypothetical protein
MKLDFEKKVSLPLSPAKALKSLRVIMIRTERSTLTIETNYEQNLNDTITMRTQRMRLHKTSTLLKFVAARMRTKDKLDRLVGKVKDDNSKVMEFDVLPPDLKVSWIMDS